MAKKLKEMAAKEGISLNALLVPYLNYIADERFVRVPRCAPQGPEQKAA